MCEHKKFDPARLERLNDPKRIEALHLDELWLLIGTSDADTIVDVGAGTGSLTVEFARLAPSAIVYAADTSIQMLEWLEAHLPEDVADNIVALKSEESHVPLADGDADVVTMFALYHELDDRPAMLAELRRLLRPGGRVLIVDWIAASTVDGPPPEIRVPTEQIVTELADAGFGDVVSHGLLDDFSVVTATRV